MNVPQTLNTERPDLPTLLRALIDAEGAVAEFFASLSPDELVTRDGDAWSASEHLMHLNMTTSAMARGFAAPRLMLRLRFGRARSPSRSYAALRDDYRAALAAGGKAPQEFVPPRVPDAITPSPQLQMDLLARWARVNARLRAGLHTWNEPSLDRLRLPHPLLGRLTAREMVCFAIYHDYHHIHAAQRRLPRFDATS